MRIVDRAAVLALYFVSALIGLSLAYDQTQAWQRFWLIAGGLALYIIVALMPERIQIARREFEPMRFFFAILPALIVIYFLFTNDWTTRLGKLAWLDPVLEWFASRQPDVAGARLDSNSLGGVLAALLPLQIFALYHRRTPNSLNATLRIVLLFITVLGVLVSESRGAWIALGIAAGLWLLWQVIGLFAPGSRARVWTAAVIALLLLGAMAAALTPLGDQLLNYRGDRWQVWSGSFDLARDYAFTGLGLGGFNLAYSSYVLLVHVLHTVHAHNLLLDIWIEQGLLGLIAFAGLVAVGVLNQPSSRWRMAALVSVAIILVHGFLDDAFYGYGGNAIPLLFVPLGALIRSSDEQPERIAADPRHLVAPGLLGVTAFIALVAAVVPSARAAFVANLGALAQTHAELGIYDQPIHGSQDRLRREKIVDLGPAIGFYETALTIDPSNATANRRLAQIEMARSDYAAARRHLEAAFASAPGERATRQMLGEVIAFDGDIASGAKLWQSIDMSASQELERQWWYESLGQKNNVDLIQQIVRASRHQ